jgi:hypothetical protein
MPGSFANTSVRKVEPDFGMQATTVRCCGTFSPTTPFRHCKIFENVGVVGSAKAQGFEDAFRLGMLATIDQQGREIECRIEMIRMVLMALPVGNERFLVVARHMQRCGEIVAGLDQRRIELHEPAEIEDGRPVFLIVQGSHCALEELFCFRRHDLSLTTARPAAAPRPSGRAGSGECRPPPG